MRQPPATPTRGRWRLIRAVVLGGASMLLATGAHLLGGGTLPAVPVLGLLTAVVGTVAVVLTARRCRLPVLLAVVLVEQVGLHLALSLPAGQVGCAAPVLGPGAMSMSAMPMSMSMSMSAIPGMSGCVGAAPAAGMSGMPSVTMMLAHLAATLATAWLLARGERLVWRLADRLLDCAAVRPRGRRPGPGRAVTIVVLRLVGTPALLAAGPRAPPGVLSIAS